MNNPTRLSGFCGTPIGLKRDGARPPWSRRDSEASDYSCAYEVDVDGLDEGDLVKLKLPELPAHVRDAFRAVARGDAAMLEAALDGDERGDDGRRRRRRALSLYAVDDFDERGDFDDDDADGEVPAVRPCLVLSPAEAEGATNRVMSRYKAKKECPTCLNTFTPQAFSIHVKYCGQPKVVYTLAPPDFRANLDPRVCPTCSLKARPKKQLNTQTNEYEPVCCAWGERGHKGAADEETARQASNEKECDRKRDMRDVDGISFQRARGDDIVHWNKPFDATGVPRSEALHAFVRDCPNWKELLGWNPNDYRDALDDVVDAKIVSLCRLVLGDASPHHRFQVFMQLYKLYPSETVSSIDDCHYSHIAESAIILVTKEDNMFGNLSPLITLLVSGLVDGALQQGMLSRQVRAVKSDNRRNAAGRQSRAALETAKKNAYHSLGPFARRALGVLRSNDVFSGLGFDGGGERLGLRATLGATAAGCDFGSLGNQTVPLMAFNSRAADEILVGDSTTRSHSRPANDDIARTLPTLGAGDKVKFFVSLDASNVIEYVGIEGDSWRRDSVKAYGHFSETYDELVFAQKSDTSWEAWLVNLCRQDGCGGVVDGFDVSFEVNGVKVGRDLFTHPLDVKISNALDANQERIADNREFGASDVPDDDWPGNRELRVRCLAACMPLADGSARRLRSASSPLMASGDASQVVKVLEACYGDVRDTAESMGADGYRTAIREQFRAQCAPAIFARLSRPRRVRVVTYRVDDLDAAPTERFVDVPRLAARVGLEAAAPAQPAPGRPVPNARALAERGRRRSTTATSTSTDRDRAFAAPPRARGPRRGRRLATCPASSAG
ncbi:hypothetical protein JL720_13215 [Aureococcus anophagefferens]|nr:hypothetical protein JL720_13215 [Aureococcus anophagefferens]